MRMRRRALMLVVGGLVTAGSMGLGSLALAADEPQVEFVTSQGRFVIELYPDKAPKTVDNFLTYVEDKFYDGTIFHRVIDGFMIQGGGFDEDYHKKETRPAIMHEGQAAAEAGLLNVRGSVAMARTGDPHSATSQFFINVQDNAPLDPVAIPPGDPVAEFEYMGHVYKDVPRANLVNNPQLFGYTVFGKVIEGMDTVDRIRAMETGSAGPFAKDAPKEQVVIESARLLP